MYWKSSQTVTISLFAICTFLKHCTVWAHYNNKKMLSHLIIVWNIQTVIFSWISSCYDNSEVMMYQGIWKGFHQGHWETYFYLKSYTNAICAISSSHVWFIILYIPCFHWHECPLYYWNWTVPEFWTFAHEQSYLKYLSMISL